MPDSEHAVTPLEIVWVRWLVRLAWAVGIVAVAAHLAEIPWRSALRGYDNTLNYLWLRSLMFDGDLNFANDIEIGDTLDEEDRAYLRGLWRTPTGHVPNKYGIGWAVVAAPAAFLADAIVAAGNVTRVWTMPRDGFGPVYQIVLHLWHVLLAFFGLVLAQRIASRWLSPPWATFGVVAVWLGSPLVYYQTTNTGMSHGTVFLAVAVATWALIRAVEDPAARWPWWLAGAGLGLAVVTRYRAVVFGLFAAAALVMRWRQCGWRGLTSVAWLVHGAVPLLLLQLCAWRIVYGRWLVFSYGAENETFHWLRPELWNVMFSAWHGLFYWHPLVLLAFGGLTWWTCTTVFLSRAAGDRLSASGTKSSASFSRESAQMYALAMFGAALATIYINGAWWCWWFAAAFGNRAFDGALLGMMVGLGLLVARCRGKTRLVVLLATTALVSWNLYVFVLYRTATISRSDPVTWLGMLQAFPRLLGQLSFD